MCQGAVFLEAFKLRTHVYEVGNSPSTLQVDVNNTRHLTILAPATY